MTQTLSPGLVRVDGFVASALVADDQFRHDGAIYTVTGQVPGADALTASTGTTATAVTWSHASLPPAAHIRPGPGRAAVLGTDIWFTYRAGRENLLAPTPAHTIALTLDGSVRLGHAATSPDSAARFGQPAGLFLLLPPTAGYLGRILTHAVDHHLEESLTGLSWQRLADGLNLAGQLTGGLSAAGEAFAGAAAAKTGGVRPGRTSSLGPYLSLLVGALTAAARTSA